MPGWGVTSYPVVSTVAFVVAMSLPVGVLALASRIAAPASRESARQNFARFGYALIPHDVAAHVNLFHLLAEGKAVLFTIGALFGTTSEGLARDRRDRDHPSPSVRTLAAGIGLSVLVVRKIAVARHGHTERARRVASPMVATVCSSEPSTRGCSLCRWRTGSDPAQAAAQTAAS